MSRASAPQPSLVPTRAGPPRVLDADEMYRAVARRDEGLAGAFIVGVRTTGIFCRPGCGARTPRRENVEFFPRPVDAIAAGYRACKRCKPLDPPDAAPEWAERALRLAESHPGRRLGADDLRAAGIDPVKAARWFKARYGVTFQGYHRAVRVGRAAAASRAGTASIRRAASTAGYESESGFRAALADLFGPAGARAEGPDARLMTARWIGSPLGPMIGVARDERIVLLEFADRRALESQLRTLRARLPGPVVPGRSPVLDTLERQLAEYFAGTRRRFDVPLLRPGTPFQAAVWERLEAIPPGTTTTYGAIARDLGRPSAVRAVARANGDNRLAILLPCHRVIGAGGDLTGYAGGLWRKQWLLEHERRMCAP